MDFQKRFGRATVSKWSKVGVWILRVISIVPSTLSVFSSNRANPVPLSKEISSIFCTSLDDGYSRLLPEFVACGNVERLDSSGAFYRR